MEESEPTVGKYAPSQESVATSLSGSLRESVDLLVLLLVNLGTIVAVAVPLLSETPLRTVLGVSFVLSVPGYAIVSALFPEADERDVEMDSGPAEPSRRTVDGVERVVLSVGLSAVVAGLSGFGLHLTPFELRPSTVLVPLTVATVLATLVAVRRRRRIPRERRFRVSYRPWLAAARAQIEGPKGELVVNVILALSIVLAGSTLGLALLFPQDGETFTEFYLLAEDESGELRTTGYPDEFELGETQDVHVAVGNYEQRAMSYTLLVELHRVGRESDSVTVVESERLASTDLRLGHNETAVESLRISPQMTGSQLRLSFLLYVDAPPTEPRISNAYRETHLWINVSQSPAETDPSS